MEAKNKTIQYSLIFLTFFLITFFSTSSLWAATYYVAQSAAGGNTGANCANAKSLSWFNSNASAGDTATLCDGTFTTRIIPTNSGSSGNSITYIADTKHAAVIQNAGSGANLSGKNYITLDGLYFNGCGSCWMRMVNSDYNIIQNCKFYDSQAWVGIILENGSFYNKFTDNIFEDAPYSGNTDGTKPADFIGFYGGNNNYNVFEGNNFGNCNHCIVFLDKGERNVFRGNTFQNQYHTGLNLNDDNANLIENNYFYDQGNDIENDPYPHWYLRNNPAIQLNGSYQIIRKNIFDNNGSGISISTYAAANTEAYYARVYNNTINKGVIPLFGEAVDANYLIGNIFKNNIFTNAEASTYPGDGRPDPFNINYRDNNGADNPFYNNCSYGQNDHRYRNYTPHTFAEIISQYPTNFPSGNITADPKYTNAGNRDFTLQSDSPMIDAGAWLTTITSSTTSGVSSFVVDDSRYFYDGWGIPGEKGDIIKTQKGEVTTITIIDYNTHTITVRPAIDIVKGEGLAFNYSGSGPDIGAYEYGGKTDMVSPPSGLVIKVSQN